MGLHQTSHPPCLDEGEGIHLTLSSGFVPLEIHCVHMRGALVLWIMTWAHATNAFTQLPNVGQQFAREPNPAKQTPLDQYVWDYDSSAGFEIHPQTYRGESFGVSSLRTRWVHCRCLDALLCCVGFTAYALPRAQLRCL